MLSLVSKIAASVLRTPSSSHAPTTSLSLQNRRRPMLFLTLPLREKWLILLLHLLQGGPFVDLWSTRTQDVSTSFFFPSCFPDVILCIFSSVEPSLLSCILGPVLLCFWTPFLRSVSLRVGTTTNLEGDSGRSEIFLVFV